MAIDAIESKLCGEPPVKHKKTSAKNISQAYFCDKALELINLHPYFTTLN